MNFSEDFAGIISSIREVLNYQLFDINQTKITLFSIVMFVLILATFFIASKIINRGLLKRILSRFQIERGIQYTLVRLSHYLVMITGTVVAFQFIGINLSGLAVIFGLLSVGIGFGLQNITSNFISGLILLFERPIRVGDRVTVGDVEGDVVAINMRSTTVTTLDNISIIIPNSDFIAARVTNWSHGDPKVRLNIRVGVSYASNLDTVYKALSEVAVENKSILTTPEPSVLLIGFGDSSWDMLLRVWLPSPKRYYQTQSDINCAIVHKFRENGIEIPFPQRDLHLRSPLPLPYANQTPV